MKSRPGKKLLAPVWAAALALCCPLLNGCTAASYGLGVAAMVDDMKARQREDYESYRRRAESEGSPRIMTFREWLRSRE